MIRGAALVVLLALAGGVAAQEEETLEPVPGAALEDPDFRVRSRQFGLERRVEMYQWRSDADSYRRVWNAAWIDSSGFAPGHVNPPGLPLPGERWWAQDARIDGRPIAPEVLRALGHWQVFRPNFSRLPGNLAATFQPDGDGLSSSENPLDPRVGDLRVAWSELVLPPLEGKVELRDGRWQLSSQARDAIAAGALADPARQSAPLIAPTLLQRLWPWGLGALVLLLLWLGRRRRRRARQRAGQRDADHLAGHANPSDRDGK